MSDGNAGKRQKIEEKTEENLCELDANSVLDSANQTEDEQVSLDGIMSLISISLLMLSIPAYYEMIQMVDLYNRLTFLSTNVQHFPVWNPNANAFNFSPGQSNNKKLYYTDLCMKLDNLQKLLPNDKTVDHLQVHLVSKNTKFCSHRHHVFHDNLELNLRVPVQCHRKDLEGILSGLTWKLEFFTAESSTQLFQMIIKGKSFGRLRDDNQLFQIILGQIKNSDRELDRVDVLAWVRGCSTGVAAGSDTEEMPDWVPPEGYLRQMFETAREYPVIIVKPDEMSYCWT